MIRLLQTDVFSKWLGGLRDSVARTRINKRLDRLALGNPGDVKALGKGLFEMRIDHGPGYRAYYFRHAQEIVVLLAGGDKKMQERDIVTAFELMEAVKATWPK